MVGINLFGFRKFELLRGGDGGGGGGEGPGGVDGDLGEFGGAGADVSGAGGTAGLGTGGEGPGAADASFGGLQGTDAATGGGGGFSFEAAEADAGGFDAVDVGFGAGDMGMSSGDLAGSDALGGLGEVDVANLGSDVSFGVSPGQAAAQVGTGYGGLFGGVSEDTLGMIDPGLGSFGAAEAMDEGIAADAAAFDQGMSGLLGGDAVSPVDFTASDAVTSDAAINPAALAAATGIVGAGIADPTETGIQDPSELSAFDAMTGIDDASFSTPVEVTVDPTNTSGATTTSIVGTDMLANIRNLMAQEEAGTGIDFTPGIQGITSPSGNLSIDAVASFNEAMSNQNPNDPTAAESLMGAPVGTGTGVADIDTVQSNIDLGSNMITDNLDEVGSLTNNQIDSASGYNPSDLTAQAVTDNNAAAITDNLSFFEDDTQEVTDAINALATRSGVTTPSGTMGLENEDVDMQAEDLGVGVTAADLYGTSPSVIDPATGLPQQTVAMDPGTAQAMTGGSTTTTNNTGMNLAQDQNPLEAANQAAAMDVLGAQIGAGNLTGNEDIDEVNQVLAQQGVQIDSGLPGLLGTGVDALNQNYQLNQNQNILTQLAQGSNAPNTGILGTGIGAVENVNTYQPAYDSQGNIVGSVAVDATGNAVGGPAGVTTNVVGGINAMPELFSDAAGTKTFTGANQAVGDFQDMVAASQSSDEGPPEDVTSVDANGCRIGSEFFNGQRCQPIETNTGDGTGGATGGGAYQPFQYQPGQGTMLRPDFSDMYTSNVQFNTLNPGASNMNFLKPAVNPYGNFAGGGIVPMMRNNSVR